MSDWLKTTLGSVLPFKYGKNLPEPRRSHSGEFQVVSSAGFVDTHFEPLTIGPAVVIGRKGSVGTVYYSADPVFPIDTTFYVEGSSGIDLRFAYYLLTWLPLTSMNSDSAVPGLNRTHAQNVEIDLPPIDEQRAIAATLGALDDKIESNRRAIALTEALVRAYYDEMFDVKFVDDGVPLTSLIEVNPKRRLPNGQLATYVGMSSLPEFSAEIYEWEKKPAGSGSRFTNGDVLMARITPCLENGKTAVVDMLDHDEVAWGSTEYIVLAPRGDIRSPWIYCLARHEEVRPFAIRSMTGSSGRQRFKADRFDQYKIARPDRVQIERFNTIAEPLFCRMTQLRNESLRARALRDTLLPELLSGRIRVPEASGAAS